MSRVAEPKFNIVATEGKIQIRDYPPVIVAEAEVAGERKQAINEGFRLIAGYIFGGNTLGQKIAMTAPVTQQANGDVWKVRFVMPEGYTLETLPKPNNNRVKLIALPPKRFAVIRFSGSQGDKNMKPHQEKLLEYVSDYKLVTTGEPIMAFYNPPWTVPFLKRNEVMIELKQGLAP